VVAWEPEMRACEAGWSGSLRQAQGPVVSSLCSLVDGAQRRRGALCASPKDQPDGLFWWLFGCTLMVVTVARADLDFVAVVAKAVPSRA